jgi:glycosyltransferase involved in cell wall biosynthesis
MRVLFITPGFAQNEEDSTCIPPLQSFARALAAQGVEPMIVALEYPFQTEAYRWHGLNVLPCGGRNRWLNKPLTILKAINYAQKAHRVKPFDVVHSFWFGLPFLVGFLISKILKIRHVCTFMGQDVNTGFYHAALWLQHPKDALVTLSAYQQTTLRETARIAVRHIIPWGLDPRDFPSERPLQAQRAIDIIGVGALVPVKNWYLWLQVVALLVRHYPRLQAILIGAGPELAALERQLRERGLQENVQLKGALPREVVLRHMTQAKILLHTADFEGFGYVLTEAAHLGCKVISTPVGCAPEWASCAVHAQALAALAHQHLQNPLQKPVHVPMMADTAQQYLMLYTNAVTSGQ